MIRLMRDKRTLGEGRGRGETDTHEREPAILDGVKGQVLEEEAARPERQRLGMVPLNQESRRYEGASEDDGTLKSRRSTQKTHA